MSDKRRLTEEQATEIRKQYKAGKEQVRLAREFGVSRQTIYVILRGLTHKPKVPISQGVLDYKKAQGNATWKVDYAVKKGVLVDLKKIFVRCTNCKKSRATQYDHRDYGKPLDVSPVCARCNHSLPRAKLTI